MPIYAILILIFVVLVLVIRAIPDQKPSKQTLEDAFCAARSAYETF